MKKSHLYLTSLLLLSLSLPGIAGNQFTETTYLASNHRNGAKVYENKEIDDATIVSEIRDKMRNEPLLKNSRIDVTSRYGKVELSGLLDTKLQAEKLVILALANPWVKWVDTTNLKTKDSKIPLTDTYITAKVKGILIRHDLLDLTSPGAIQVETKNKVVYLSGYVDSQDHMDKVVSAAKSIQDVIKVQNGLKIK